MDDQNVTSREEEEDKQDTEEPKTEEPTPSEPQTETPAEPTEPTEEPVFEGVINGTEAAKNKKYSGSIVGHCGKCNYNFKQLLTNEMVKCPRCQNRGL